MFGVVIKVVYVFAGHPQSEYVLLAGADVILFVIPGAPTQRLHAVVSVTFEYVPAVQFVHVVPVLFMYIPTGQ
jgi:hypothetical protein